MKEFGKSDGNGEVEARGVCAGSVSAPARTAQPGPATGGSPGEAASGPLHRTIRFFEEFLRASPDGIVISDASQAIVRVNEAFCALLGRHRREVMETNLLTWLAQLDPDAPARWIETEARTRTEGVCREAEFRLTGREGVRYLSVSASPLDRVGGEEPGAIISIWRDVTDQTRSREELEARVAERAAQLAETNRELRVAVARHEHAEKTMAFSHRLLAIANRHSRRIPLLREFVGEVREFTGCGAVGIRVLDDRGNIPYEAHAGFSREFYELESPLSIARDACMCINVITGETDAALPFYTEGGSFYINAMTRVLATVSDRDTGPMRNTCSRMGYESAALVPIRRDDQIFGLIHVADNRENMVPLEMVEALEQVAGHLCAAILRVDAEETLERRLAERTGEVERSERQRMETEKMAALGQIAAGVAHEINNPLTAVRNAFYLIRDAVPADHEHRRFVSIIDSEVDRIAGITSRMYELYDPAGQQPADVDVNAVVSNVIKLVEPKMAGKRVRFEDGRSAGLPTTHVPASQITQILWNPVANAIDAMKGNGGGTLTIRTSHRGGRIAVEVEDDGPGIAQNDLPHLFEPFFSTKRTPTEGGGMGLGLSITRSLVQSLGGSITIRSRPGEGTRCTIELPIRPHNAKGASDNDDGRQEPHPDRR